MHTTLALEFAGRPLRFKTRFDSEWVLGAAGESPDKSAPANVQFLSPLSQILLHGYHRGRPRVIQPPRKGCFSPESPDTAQNNNFSLTQNGSSGLQASRPTNLHPRMFSFCHPFHRFCFMDTTGGARESSNPPEKGVFHLSHRTQPKITISPSEWVLGAAGESPDKSAPANVQFLSPLSQILLHGYHRGRPRVIQPPRKGCFSPESPDTAQNNNFSHRRPPQGF